MTAAANIMNLGGCEMVPSEMTILAACERLNSHSDAHGRRILAVDVACLSTAKTCKEAAQCD